MRTRGSDNRKNHAGKALNRREFLKLGGAGIAGMAVLGIARLASTSPATSALNLGISESNTAVQNRKNLVEALTNSERSVVFPPGDYRVDNSPPYAVISNFEGELLMEPGARFVFTDNASRGLTFEGGNGAKFYGLSSIFEVLPPERITPEECIQFWKTYDTVVENVSIDGSVAAGLLFGECTRPSVTGATITRTMADGLHFANCQDAHADRIYTDDTGDDGLAFLNYRAGPDYSGGKATNITAKRSRARGIAVVGQRDIIIDGFTVDTTRANGLHCAYETSWDTRVPGNVIFQNGSTHRGGEVGGTPGTNYGINISFVTSVEFANVKVVSPGARGVSSLAPDGTVRLHGIEVQDARESGFNLQAGTYYLDELTAVSSKGTGFYIADGRTVEYGRLHSVNSSTEDHLRRAFGFENNTRVVGGELIVADDQRRPTGFKVNAFGRQDGDLGVIRDRVANAEVRVNNPSGLAYSLR